jgi:hypothetical protein
MCDTLQYRAHVGKPGRRPGFRRCLFLLNIFSMLMSASMAATAQISYLPGWPVAVQAPTGRPIYIADIDDDGTLELVTMTIGNNFQNAMLYAFKSDGTIVSGFPIAMGHFFEGDPALFDSDDDGKMEMAVSQDRNLYLRDQQGNAIWSIPYNGPVFQSIYHPFHLSVDDIDNDGTKEIVVTCYSGGAVFVFDAQGNVRPGWPVILPPGCSPCGPPQIQASASIGDIDNDGVKEVVVPLAGSHFIHCLKPDGTYCAGFPVDTINVNIGQATLADIDGDQYLEIILANVEYFIILKYDGAFYPDFPIWGYTSTSAPSVTMSTGEWLVAFGAARSLYYENYLYRLDPVEILPGWPATVTGWHFSNTPLFADIHDTSTMEIVTGAYSNAFVSDGRLYAYDMAANVIPGFPTANLYHRGITKTGAVNDLNGDGNLDICYGSTNKESSTSAASTVYCWDTGYPYNLDNVDWAMDGFDLGHTGRWRRLYHINKASSQLSVISCQGQGNPCYLPPDGSLISVTVTAVRQSGGANPSTQDVRYSRTLGCGNYEGPVIDHGDGTYTRMLRAPTADCTTDVHAWVNEFKLQDYQQIVFTNSCFQAPDAFNLLSPPNGAFNQPPTVILTWPAVGSFPNQASSYDLYFGAFANPPLKAAWLTTTQYTVSGLAPNTRYCWKVVARNACGETPSAIWCFTRASCTAAPQSFNNLSPANGATGVPLPVNLTWTAASGAAQYDVYLGADPASLTLAATVYKPQATLTGLSYRKTYYWRIIAKNPCGSTSGPLWTFTTQFPFPKPIPRALEKSLTTA